VLKVVGEIITKYNICSIFKISKKSSKVLLTANVSVED
jgi:hypothetical protein